LICRRSAQRPEMLTVTELPISVSATYPASHVSRLTEDRRSSRLSEWLSLSGECRSRNAVVVPTEFSTRHLELRAPDLLHWLAIGEIWSAHFQSGVEMQHLVISRLLFARSALSSRQIFRE
jgi:hypothetical protein